MAAYRDPTGEPSDTDPELSPEDRAWLEERLEEYHDLLEFLKSH